MGEIVAESSLGIGSIFARSPRFRAGRPPLRPMLHRRRRILKKFQVLFNLVLKHSPCTFAFNAPLMAASSRSLSLRE